MSKFLINSSQFSQFISEGGYAEQGQWTTNGWMERLTPIMFYSKMIL